MFETFNEFVEIKKVLSPHLPILIEAALKVSANSNYSINLREITLLFLERVAEKYGRVIIKRGGGVGVMDKIVETAFVIASESEEPFDGEEETRKNIVIDLFIPPLYSSYVSIAHDI